MKKPLLIFGIGDIAQLAHHYFNTDSEYEVIAFTVDAAYLTDKSFCDLPVVAFEEINNRYSPEECEFFIALSYTKLNELRKEKYLAVKALGYQITSYVSSHATILNDGQIGENCFILEDNTIQQFKGFDTVISTGIIHQRHPKTAFYGMGKGLQDLRDHVARGDKINVMTPLFLEIYHYLG